MGCFIGLLLISCIGQEFKPNYSKGYATALMNGEYWKGVIEPPTGRPPRLHGNLVDFSFSVYDEIGQLRQYLAFNNIPLKKGRYPLFYFFGPPDSLPECFYNKAISDGDITEDFYGAIEGQSTITITDYNEEARLLMGEFSVKLCIPPIYTKHNPNNPDTIIFENGQFIVKLE